MTNIPKSKWKWYGYAGHFIGGKSCSYHLSTRIGKYLVSTIGDYRPFGKRGERETLGSDDDSWFETYVFRCDGESEHGDPILASWAEIDGERYAVSIEAERGHYRYCEKYASGGED